MHDNDGSLPTEGLQPLLTTPTQLHLAKTYSCRVIVSSCRAHQQTAKTTLHTTFEQCVVVVWTLKKIPVTRNTQKVILNVNVGRVLCRLGELGPECLVVPGLQVDMRICVKHGKMPWPAENCHALETWLICVCCTMVTSYVYQCFWYTTLFSNRVEKKDLRDWIGKGISTDLSKNNNSQLNLVHRKIFKQRVVLSLHQISHYI